MEKKKNIYILPFLMILLIYGFFEIKFFYTIFLLSITIYHKIRVGCIMYDLIMNIISFLIIFIELFSIRIFFFRARLRG